MLEAWVHQHPPCETGRSLDAADGLRPCVHHRHVGQATALPERLQRVDNRGVDALKAFGQSGGLAYVAMMNARPQAVGYGLTDSPAGLAGWMLVHPGFEHWSFGKDPNQSPTRDDVLDNFTLYWLTNSAASSARIYWENRGRDLISAGRTENRRDLGPGGHHRVSG